MARNRCRVNLSGKNGVDSPDSLLYTQTGVCSLVTISFQLTGHSPYEVDNPMTIDTGTYLVLHSATGAFTCKYPPVPKTWNHIDRPHVALLLQDENGILPVFLSQPQRNSDGHRYALETTDLTSLPAQSIIEVRHNGSQYAYYRREGTFWTKVAEANDPFVVEVFSHGYTPVSLNMSHTS